MTIRFFLAGSLLAVPVLLSLVGAVQVAAQPARPRARVVFGDTTVSVEIADTEAIRQRGLMFRERLAPNDGMIFVFDEPGAHPFWMKNTLIPLDILWLDAQMKVLHIARSVPPCTADPCPTYPPASGTQASYVLEVVAGFASQHAVTIGDTLVVHGLPGRP